MINNITSVELCTPDQLRDFYSEFGLDEQSVKERTKEIIEWMRQTPHLPNFEDEDYVSNFLFRCKMDTNKAKKRLESYFKLKSKMLDVFDYFDPNSHVDQVIKLACWTALPKLTPEGSRILLYRIFDPSICDQINVDDAFRTFHMMMELSLKIDKIRDIIIMVDFEGANFMFIAKLMSSLRRFMTVALDMTPMRFRQFIVLKLSKMAYPVYYLAKTILPRKLTKRIVIWQDETDQVNRIIPKECLPIEYGGDLPNTEILRDKYYNDVKSNEAWLKYIANVRGEFE